MVDGHKHLTNSGITQVFFAPHPKKRLLFEPFHVSKQTNLLHRNIFYFFKFFSCLNKC